MENRSSVGICAGKSKPKIAIFPQADTNPEKVCEISEHVLFRCLQKEATMKVIGDSQANETSKILKEIDLKSKISQVETHKSRNVMLGVESDNIIVVFQTTSEEDGGHWWSLEESADRHHVTMQRSHEKNAVKNQFKGESRNQVEPIAEGLKGKGSIKHFLILLWIHIVIDLKCQTFLSSCESFIPLVMKELTETFYEYPPNYFTYSALSSEEINSQMEEIINLLTKVATWHPLLCLTYLGDISQFDKVLGNVFFQFKIDGIYNKLTLLNFAILFSRTNMVRHLLETKYANARKCDKAGRNALHMAALFTDEEEIIKLLLNSKIKVDGRGRSGMTALHYAAIASNLTVATHLIRHDAKANILDLTDHSPLHLAAHYATNSQILELLLTKVEIDQCDSTGITALHSAAIASNAVSARYLLERGADINRADKRGRTPVHAAAAFAKDIDFFNIFLERRNEKANLECCDERKLTVLAYAQSNQYGQAEAIVSRIERENNLLLVPDANQPEEKQEITDPTLLLFLLNKETLELFKDTQAEIPEMLGVLKKIDKESKVTRFEIHQSSTGSMADLKESFHVFILFKTTSETDNEDCWWSLEKNLNHIVLQRSGNKDDVKTKFYGERRKQVKPVKEDLKGKGTIKDLFALLWAQQTIAKKYHLMKSNCQSFVTLISQQITEIGYECHGVFPCSPRLPPEHDHKKTKILDLVSILTGYSKLHPLFVLIHVENTDLIDVITQSGNYNINALHKGYTPLHLAIAFSKTKMVKHLLKDPINADPTTRDEYGKDALQTAAMSAKGTEIIDSLLAHSKVKVDDVDQNGRTALHAATVAFNVIAVKHLIDRGANPGIFDKNGASPLHEAAELTDDIKIIDLLLEAKKVKGMGDVNDQNKKGETALHRAAAYSNEITAEHLIKKGADLHCWDIEGRTPLHVAAMHAMDMQIIDLLLKNIKSDDIEPYRKDAKLFICANTNEHGLGAEIIARLAEKGIARTEGSGATSTTIQKFDSAFHFAVRANRGDMVRHWLKRGDDPTRRDKNGLTPFQVAARVQDTNVKILNLLVDTDKVDINDQGKSGLTALHFAIINYNVTAVRFMLSNGANPNVADENGATPLHLAAKYAKDMDIVELLLNHPDVDVNYLDKRERNALDYATMNKHGQGDRIVNRLKEMGAAEISNLAENLEELTRTFNTIRHLSQIFDKPLKESGAAKLKHPPLIYKDVDVDAPLRAKYFERPVYRLEKKDAVETKEKTLENYSLEIAGKAGMREDGRMQKGLDDAQPGSSVVKAFKALIEKKCQPWINDKLKESALHKAEQRSTEPSRGLHSVYNARDKISLATPPLWAGLRSRDRPLFFLPDESHEKGKIDKFLAAGFSQQLRGNFRTKNCPLGDLRH